MTDAFTAAWSQYLYDTAHGAPLEKLGRCSDGPIAWDGNVTTPKTANQEPDDPDLDDEDGEIVEAYKITGRFSAQSKRPDEAPTRKALTAFKQATITPLDGPSFKARRIVGCGVGVDHTPSQILANTWALDVVATSSDQSKDSVETLISLKPGDHFTYSDGTKLKFLLSEGKNEKGKKLYQRRLYLRDAIYEVLDTHLLVSTTIYYQY
eukprot:SAG11_NODE_5314_length_1599_cov_1.846667_1_plen_207_part_10